MNQLNYFAKESDAVKMALSVKPETDCLIPINGKVIGCDISGKKTFDITYINHVMGYCIGYYVEKSI